VPQLEPAFTLFSQHTKHIWVKSINGMGTHTHPPTPHTRTATNQRSKPSYNTFGSFSTI
jgi:hypothetical protein